MTQNSHENAWLTGDLKAIKRLLAKRAEVFLKNNKVLHLDELLALYRFRHQYKPSQKVLLLLLGSIIYETYRKPEQSYTVSPGDVDARQNELGWFWFRCCSKHRMERMLNQLILSRHLELQLPAKRYLSFLNNEGRVDALPKKVCKPKIDRLALIKYLENNLNGENDEVAVAVRSLAEYRNVDDLPLFRKLAGSSNYSTRSAVAEALGKYRHPADVNLLVKLAKTTGSRPIDSLLAYPGRIVEKAVKRLLASKHSTERSNLLLRLTDWKHPDARQILLSVSQSEESEERAIAVAGLGELGNPKDLPLLRKMSCIETETVRREAIWAVAKFKKKADVLLFKKRTVDESAGVRQVAAMALTKAINRQELEEYFNTLVGLPCAEVLIEYDFALYAPEWLANSSPRYGNLTVLTRGNLMPMFGCF